MRSSRRPVKDIALQAFYDLQRMAGTPNEVICFVIDNNGNELRWFAIDSDVSFGREYFERPR